MELQRLGKCGVYVESHKALAFVVDLFLHASWESLISRNCKAIKGARDHIFCKNLTANCSKTAYELLHGPCSILFQFPDSRVLCFSSKTFIISSKTFYHLLLFFFFLISFPPQLRKQKCLLVSCSHLSVPLTCAWNLWQPCQSCSELFIVEKVEKKNNLKDKQFD